LTKIERNANIKKINVIGTSFWWDKDRNA